MGDHKIGTGPNNSAAGAASLGEGVISGLTDRLGTLPLVEGANCGTPPRVSLQKIIASMESPPLIDHRSFELFPGGREHQGHHCQECDICPSLSVLRQYYDLLPMARLPPEILSRIFVLSARMEGPEGWAWAARTCSRVCRRWRQVALDCPELWSLIYCHDRDHPKWLAKLIGRSGSFPLSFFGYDQGGWHKEMMALVADNMHRFESIDLYIPENEYHAESLFETFSQSASLLQDLTLTSHCHRGPTYTFPHNFFGGDAPNLRHIRLFTPVHVPWNSGLFSNLATLEIVGGMPYESASLEMPLAALTRMPGLELLILRHCLPSVAQTAGCVHVNLPNLKRLELTGTIQCAAEFLNMITISNGATLILGFEQDDITPGDIDRFIEVFSSHPWAASLPIHALNLTWVGCVFRADAWPVQQHSGVADPEIANITLTFSPVHTGHPDIAFACFTVFASPHLRSFRISDDDNTWKWDVHVWGRLMRMAPGLLALAVGGAAHGVELCKVLRPPGGLKTAPEDCYLPALIRLDLTARHDHPMTTSDAEATQLSAVLARSLAMRGAIGCSVPELVFIVPPSEVSAEGWSEPFREVIPRATVRENHDLGEG